MHEIFQIIIGGVLCLVMPGLAAGWAIYQIFRDPVKLQEKRDLEDARYATVRGKQRARATKQAFLDVYGPDEYYRRFGVDPFYDLGGE
ncbi:hypothetical protein [Rhodococcus aetherivorans]|uniref:hypothetical protein n=1 Tax=Rhodococcus aetherivorans TaxID=191292 RepID=UPI00294932FE|nr:hypothetical protein [Rhodococcus aetherivorans]MDV6295167.1 hypothetical protein [Rhodococcus aetherivorans]